MRVRSLIYALVLLPLLWAVWLSHQRLVSLNEQTTQQAALSQREAESSRGRLVRYARQAIPYGAAFVDVLQRAGLDRATANRATAEAQRVFDLRRVRAGNPLDIGREASGLVRAVRYQADPENVLWILRRGDDFAAHLQRVTLQSETVTVTGTVRDSLFNAVTEGGERPQLALALADIFGWDIDFYTDTRPGDTFRAVVEKRTSAKGETVLYGRLLAAEYNNHGNQYQAVLFRDPSGQAAYYAPDGKSLKKAFLRSPLKFSAPITSRFSKNRLHPVLKRHRPHLGIDYGAPTGTPVQAVADGTVVFAGHKGGGGKTVHLRHARGYETMYLHLSRIMVRNGQRVAQGQLVGLVGRTGLATGPHLDFRVRHQGAYKNFETLRLPPAHPVAQPDWQEFLATREYALGMLHAPDTVMAAGTRQPGEGEPASSP